MAISAEQRAAAVERIKKLMAVSSGEGATEAEVELYLKKARQMMDQFAVEESELNATPENRERAYESIVTMEIYKRAGSIDQWDRQIAWIPCLICDVRFYTKKDYFKNKRDNSALGEVMIFYGMPRDCEVAAALYMELLATMRAMCKFSLGRDWQSGFSSYCLGFTGRLCQRAKELKATSASSPENTQSGCTAIIILKDQLLDRKKEELGIGNRKGRRSSVKDSAAYGAGMRDGNNVSLGTNQLKSSAPAPRRLS